jgi:LacI family transcriptional regulator
MRERTEGYKRALMDASIPVDDNLIKVLPFSHDNKDVARAIKELVGKPGNKKVDAILFSTSKLGINGIESITAMGLKIPDDIAIVSFDNPDAYKICISPVTVVNQPLKDIGKTAVQIIINELKHPDAPAKIQKITLKTDLIIRKSCGS